jgi:adenosine deaminase
MRPFNPAFGPYFRQLGEVHRHEDPRRIAGLASMALVTAAHDIKVTRNVPIVAIDIAGAERGYPNDEHTEAFAYAHKKFMNKTVHAGEGYGAESIFQAITDLHAERIGHGYQ